MSRASPTNEHRAVDDRSQSEDDMPELFENCSTVKDGPDSEAGGATLAIETESVASDDEVKEENMNEVDDCQPDGHLTGADRQRDISRTKLTPSPTARLASQAARKQRTVPIPKPVRKLQSTHTFDADYYAARPFKCEECPTAYLQMPHLYRHSENVHQIRLRRRSEIVFDAAYYAARSHKCPDCSRAYDTHYRLRKHAALAHDVVRRQLTEPAFDEKFYSNKPHRCDQCKMAYGKKVRLRKHCITMHRVVMPSEKFYTGRPHKCDKCSSSFTRLNELARHQITQHFDVGASVKYGDAYYAVRTHKCARCPLAYCGREGLVRHGRITHGKTPTVNATSPVVPTPTVNDAPRRHKCAHCDRSYVYRGDLNKHAEQAHDVPRRRLPPSVVVFDEEYYSNKPHRCDNCAMAYSHKGRLVTHAKFEHGVALTTHVVRPVKGTIARPHKGDDCSMSLNKPACASTQKTTRAPPTHDADYYAERPHKCAHCNAARRRYHQLRIHCKATHGVEMAHRQPVEYDADYYAVRAHRCEQCNEARTTRRYLRIHCKAVHDVDIGGVTRTPVRRSVSRSASVRRSPSSLTALTHRFRCADYYDGCDRSCMTLTGLYLHQRRHHADALEYNAVYYAARTHKCEHCPKAFVRVDRLQCHVTKVHKVRHLKERPTPPTQAASTPMRRATPRPSAFPCADYYDNCGRSYMTLKGLLLHHGTAHADAFEYNAVYYAARAHRCEHCPKAFNAIGYLRRHLRNVHNDNSPVVDAPRVESESPVESAAPTYSCQFCASTPFESVDALNAHMISAHNISVVVRSGRKRRKVRDEKVGEQAEKLENDQK